MNKVTKISKTLNETFGDQRQDIRVIMPKAFLANLSTELDKSNKRIAEAVTKIDNKELLETLIADNKELKGLMTNLEDAIRESRVDQVEILNLPEQKEIKIPEYPKEINVKKPSWFEKFNDTDLKTLIKGGFEYLGKQLNLDKYKDKKNALAVRLVDKTGRSFYDAMFQAISGSVPNFIDTHTMGYADGAWRGIGTHLTTAGDYHLGTSIQQNVYDDANNSSTANLASGATFTGTATSTLGVVGLQWSLYTTENCTVCIEESPDGTNWDISYCFDYIASKGGRGETVQASQAYWRIRVTNEGTLTTTAFRLQGVLCPVATPLPSDLSSDGRLKSQSTITGQENTERNVWVNPTNELNASPVYRMVGTSFDGDTKDPNFWTETLTVAGAESALGSGSVTKNSGEIEIETGATANSGAIYQSVRKARFVAGSAQLLTGAINWVTAGTANNRRRIGAYTLDASLDIEDGFFFQLDGTTFSIGHSIAGTPTLVSSGSFNGNMGDEFTPTANKYYKIAIEFTPVGALWYINGKLLHKVNGHLSATLTLPITFETENSGGATADVAFNSLGMYIARQGELITNPIYYHVSGNAVAEKVLKYGAGVLHKVMYNNTSGTSLTLYDGTSVATGNVIGIITTTANCIGEWAYDCPFSDGLVIKTIGNSLDATIVYE